MGQTLTNGIYLPAEGERNCYEGLAANWTALDGLIGGYNAHVGNATIHVTAADKEAWNGKADASALTTHTGDTTIHVTAEDKAKWDAVTGKADDADVVHKSGNETIAGVKTFSDDTYIKSLNFTNEVPSPSSSSSSIMPIITTITYGDSSPAVQARLNFRVTADGTKSFYPHENSAYSLGLSSHMWSDFYSYHGYFGGQKQGDEYSSNARTNLTLLANRDTLGKSGCVVDTFRSNTSQGTSMHILGFGIKENSVRYEGCRFSWLWDNDLSGYTFDFKPTTQGANQAVKHNLGTSTDKWDTLNGINPGALSLPDLSNGIDISSYISVTGGQNVLSTYTAPTDGWISINLGRTSGAIALLISNGSYSVSGRDITFPDAHRECPGILPVLKNDTVTILSNLADSVLWAYFYPCQGNV